MHINLKSYLIKSNQSNKPVRHYNNCLLQTSKTLLIKLSSTHSYVNKGNNKISEQCNKGNVKTHKYINRQNQLTTGKL